MKFVCLRQRNQVLEWDCVFTRRLRQDTKIVVFLTPPSMQKKQLKFLIINKKKKGGIYRTNLSNKFRLKVMKVLDRIIIRIVKPAYKGLAATVEKMKPPIEKTFDEKKDDIIKVYKQMKEKLMG